ncbi:hypothetical protein IQ268_13335 [Oculatella sp. LEGE 06141]|uniref:hypothetical protein n=1 Tax=Oculatella sp. LEGE 06141 TaxID=1828648 RepID=UPI00187F2851|nr:hypothetical protein [Oculatella sp. LEGE 06141]MBE9179547.1 hypothetical protein [Oculatella sp. LEGE 06141]
MSNSDRTQPSAKVSDPTLAKLLEIEATLAAHAAELQGQLESIQQKRKSLGSVITMFNGNHNPAAMTSAAAVLGHSEAPTSPATTTPSALASPPADTAATESSSAGKSKAGKSTATATPSQKSQSSGGTSSAAKKPRTTRAAKKDENWQKYVREEFAQTSLPAAVSTILQNQPKEIFGIPDFLETIFLDEMPKEARNKASNRISNILSTGLKDNKWYRGRMGHYSASSTAAMSDLAS